METENKLDVVEEQPEEPDSPGRGDISVQHPKKPKVVIYASYVKSMMGQFVAGIDD